MTHHGLVDTDEGAGLASKGTAAHESPKRSDRRFPVALALLIGALCMLQVMAAAEAGVVAVAPAFSPDGKMLGSASADSTLRLWDVSIGRKS